MKNVFIALLLMSNTAMAIYIGYGQKISKPNQQKSKTVKQDIEQELPSTRELMAGTVRSRFSELEKCYNRYLASAPQAKAEGTIYINWEVNQQGHIGALNVKSTDFEDSLLSDCVTEQVKSWSFPEHEEEQPVTLAHKFTFRQKTPTQMEF